MFPDNWLELKFNIFTYWIEISNIDVFSLFNKLKDLPVIIYLFKMKHK